MELYNIFIALTLTFVAINITTGIVISSWLSRRGVKINVLLWRLFIVKYVSQYRALTISETGHSGRLFYIWIVSINLALLSAIAMALSLV